MPLRLVDVQHLLDLKVQGAVEMGQTFRNVLMYRGLTDAEFRGGGADRGPVLYDVKSQAFRPLFHITLQSATLPAFCCSILCGGKRAYAERVWHNAGFSTGTEP